MRKAFRSMSSSGPWHFRRCDDFCPTRHLEKLRPTGNFCLMGLALKSLSAQSANSGEMQSSCSYVKCNIETRASGDPFMSVVYVNNFDHLLYTWHGPKEVAGSMAALDSPIYVPGRPISFIGPMHAGASPVVPRATIELTATDQGLSEGTAVTLFNATIYQARTFFADAPNEILLSRGTLFQAELIFDRPTAVLPAGLSGKVWSVQLFFKTGNATDLTTNTQPELGEDVKVGAVCQFNDNGYVKFHGTDNMWVGPTTATYSDYSQTEFRLTAAIEVGSGGAITGTCALQYDNTLQWGHVLVLNDPATGLPVTADKLTAAGFLLTTLGDYASFGVRLRSYTLSIT